MMWVPYEAPGGLLSSGCLGFLGGRPDPRQSDQRDRRSERVKLLYTFCDAEFLSNSCLILSHLPSAEMLYVDKGA